MSDQASENEDSRPLVTKTWTADTDDYADPTTNTTAEQASCACDALFELLAAHPTTDLASIRLRVIDTNPSTYTVEATGRADPARPPQSGV